MGGTMADQPSAADILLNHYERVTGSHAQFTEVSPRGSKPGVFAAIHRGFPRPNAITGFTAGLSHVHSPANEGHTHRELVIAMADDDPAWALAAAFVAYQLRGRCGFDHGDAINFREQIASKSRMAAFLVVRPILISPADAEIDLDVRTVALRQLIPLYESERTWLMSGGNDSIFLQRFSPDELMDARRLEFQA